MGGCEQNGVSLLTPVSDSVFIALSDGTFLFSLHGSFKNHQHKALWLAVGIVSTNQVMVKWATIQSKMNGTIWKSIENLIKNWSQKFHTMLLWVISLKNQQWLNTEKVPKHVKLRCTGCASIITPRWNNGSNKVKCPPFLCPKRQALCVYYVIFPFVCTLLFWRHEPFISLL